VSDQNSHTLPGEAQIGANPFAQLAILQWVTGNKTFPTVCDQYTIKQIALPNQRRRFPPPPQKAKPITAASELYRKCEAV
jgi:hypothetical protein